MESAFKSLSSSATKPPSFMVSKAPPFPQPPATPPLLPLPARVHAPPQHAAWPPASLPVAFPAQGASAPIPVAAAPSKKGAAVDWTAATDSLYSVSPPPSCVPMPTSLLLGVAAGRKAPTACAVEVAGGGGGGVDVGATDELRRLLRL
uniref:Uncharacterized protein n=1 Tax=Leersia perrieri TaxID=77586 RepID=A0A0D9XG45_9ORYZ